MTAFLTMYFTVQTFVQNEIVLHHKLGYKDNINFS